MLNFLPVSQNVPRWRAPPEDEDLSKKLMASDITAWHRDAQRQPFNLYLSPADNNDSNFLESFHLLFAWINPHWNAKCFHNWFFHLHYIWIRNESDYIIIIK